MSRERRVDQRGHVDFPVLRTDGLRALIERFDHRAAALVLGRCDDVCLVEHEHGRAVHGTHATTLSYVNQDGERSRNAPFNLLDVQVGDRIIPFGSDGTPSVLNGRAGTSWREQHPAQVEAVHDGDGGMQPQAGELRNVQEHRRDRRWVCHTTALHENVVVACLRPRQLAQLRGEVILQRRAHRPALQRQHSHGLLARAVALAIVLPREVHASMVEEAAVNIQRGDIVSDGSDPPPAPRLMIHDVLQRRSLASAEKAAQDRHRRGISDRSSRAIRATSSGRCHLGAPGKSPLLASWW